MRDNQGKGYENLILDVFRAIYGHYDEDDPNQNDEYVEMLDFWSTEKTPGLYDPARPGWIKARAQEWIDYQAGKNEGEG